MIQRLRQICVSGASVLRAFAASKEAVIRSHNSIEAFFLHTQAPKTAGIALGLIPNPLIPRQLLVAPRERLGQVQLAGEKLASELGTGRSTCLEV